MTEFGEAIGFDGDDFPIVQAADVIDSILEGRHVAPGLEVVPGGFTYIMAESNGYLSSTRNDLEGEGWSYSLLHFHDGVMSRVDVVKLGELSHPSYASNELPDESPAIKATIALGADLGII